MADAAVMLGLARVDGADLEITEQGREFDTAIEWGRYGELFEYDSESGQLILDSDPATI